MAGSLSALLSVRRQFWRLIVDGVSSVDAAVAVGVSPTCGKGWFRQSGGMSPILLDEPSGRYLSLSEREEIAIGIAVGLGVREIAGLIGRSPSTVSREIGRNQVSARTSGPVRYRAQLAQAKAELRARRPKSSKLAADQVLAARVQTDLEKLWSPRQISKRLRADFPDMANMQVSHEAIYQALYVQGRGGLRRELHTCLRTGRALRKPRKRVQGETRGQIPDAIAISERPAEAADRAVPGHWEGDLIVGKNSGSAIGTLVERTTRYCLLLHLPGKHGAEQVRDQMITAINTLPAHLWRSLTWDRGREMSAHRQITDQTGIDIYFADPASPWQRGSNENTNGLLRQYFPKGTDLSTHSAGHLDFVAAQLNGRPRETLDWATPAEKLNQLLSSPFDMTTVATTS